MVHRSSLVLLIVGVLIAGYVTSGTPVTAQTEPLPLAIGETVILRYNPAYPTEASPWVECSVMEIRGAFVKCAPAAQRRIGAPPPAVLWRNLQSVAIIQKDQ